MGKLFECVSFGFGIPAENWPSTSSLVNAYFFNAAKSSGRPRSAFSFLSVRHFIFHHAVSAFSQGENFFQFELLNVQKFDYIS
jgi:hypothetical protein